MSAADRMRRAGSGEDFIALVLSDHAKELAAKIQAARDEVREADWGKGSRSKRPFLQGMEKAQRLIEQEVMDDAG